MIIFRYDKSFDGLLSTVFEAYSHKCFPEMLLDMNEPAPLFSDEQLTVETDERKSTRVWEGLRKRLSSTALSLLTWCWLSDIDGVDTLLFRYIRKAIDSPTSIETNFADDDVLTLSKIWKKVSWERLRIMQFLRFQKAADGTYFAAIEPRHNALPLTIGHFADRFSDQRWLIYDIKRRYGFYHDNGKVEQVTFDNEVNDGLVHLTTGWLDEDLIAEDELMWQRLWQTYFKSVAIKERLNPRKHRQDMPIRYWKYLTEKRVR
jgi:probable DNA metabolism protein